MTLSILVPVPVFESVEKRLLKIAAQCGVEVTVNPGFSVMFRKTGTRKIDLTRAIECARVTVGDMPSVSGFSLLGKLTHLEGGNIVAIAPDEQGIETPEEWRTCAPVCDHCRTDRRRTETFLVRCPDGSVKRIGRNCLADFLKADASTLVALSAFQDKLRELTEEEDGDSFGGRGEWCLTTLSFLAAAVRSTEKDGFFKTDSDRSTVGACLFACGSKPLNANSAARWRDAQPTDKDLERAQLVIDWVKNATDNSDYFHNLKLALSNSVAVRQTMGIIASAPQAYNRAMGQLAERAARDAAPDAGPVGAVGERIEVTATVLRVKAIEGQFGSKLVVSMRTDKGNELVTFTTGQGVNSNDIGKTFTVRGTVKKHTVYSGKSQTNLGRCMFKAQA